MRRSVDPVNKKGGEKKESYRRKKGKLKRHKSPEESETSCDLLPIHLPLAFFSRQPTSKEKNSSSIS
jgi:hypothetical protein